MLSILTDTLPKPVLAGAVLWAGVSYFLTGPEAASRIARADFVPVCEADIKTLTMQAGDARLRALPKPSLDPMREHAADTVRRLQNNPFMNQLRMMGGGMGDMLGIDGAANAALAQMEQAKRTAKAAYDQARERIKAETAGNIAKAGDVCSCVADMAIRETLSDWAIYAGTVTLFQPSSLKNFAQVMAQAYGAGGCDAAGKAGA